jgi:arabinogalactan oligomer/maltooligosaccharide transport system permease protein
MVEAARVDGASGLQVFRKITLPLLLVAVTPLLIASFAFNFNNFNAIYFLTEGGPYGENQSVAGATDLLVSYTYKVAFQTGRGGDFGLAAALSILIFLIIGTISAVTFIRTKALESIA